MITCLTVDSGLRMGNAETDGLKTTWRYIAPWAAKTVPRLDQGLYINYVIANVTITFC